MTKIALLVASAMAMALTASPALAKGGKGNASGNGNGGGNTPAPAPAPAPAGCGYAAGVVVSSTSYMGCQGFFAGNWVKGSDLDEPAGLITFGVPDAGDWLVKVEGDKTPLVGGLIDFGQTLYGETIVGVHFGNIYNPQNLVLGGQGNNENVTVFWLFDFGTTGSSGVQLLNARGYSNAALYGTGTPPAVPEPATWAMLILGFGAVGGAMRSASKRRTTLAFG